MLYDAITLNDLLKPKMMDKDEIKKALYRQKPIARITMIRKGTAHYSAILDDETEIRFEVPVNDMGDADFFPTMDAKLLIRYLV